MAARKATDTVALTVRVREELRKRLERESQRNDRSLNNEITTRLENSFAQTERLEEIFGGARNLALFRSLSGTIASIEAQTGRSWNEDSETREEVMLRTLATIKFLSLKTTSKQRALTRTLADKLPLSEAEEIQQIAQIIKSVLLMGGGQP
ncbi:Arc family DNA-binding protein [Bradyrhizobium liaoningense]|uniref:Arc family DNA-binding protein n=1 Tax=Bradyrhizobium liaoningense TaxID=43992 RepID=UPI001BA70F4C|nr:Arc family DNA-binding protein [Bradyrhizobium liaoningense]MBR0901219.1 Arc family DNA-binding protein [Bradyrhizobium liaoningense]